MRRSSEDDGPPTPKLTEQWNLWLEIAEHLLSALRNFELHHTKVLERMDLRRARRAKELQVEAARLVDVFQGVSRDVSDEDRVLRHQQLLELQRQTEALMAGTDHSF